MTNQELLDTLDKEDAARMFLWLAQIEYKYTKNARCSNVTNWMKKESDGEEFSDFVFKRLTTKCYGGISRNSITDRESYILGFDAAVFKVLKLFNLDSCETCKYNTNDYVCHYACSGCNGKSNYKPK